eukprot:m.44376 g.44376  ORF g.44376 m.44376 type:complete len:538 (-) comp10904_c0_seq1:23-1636(-)
MTTCSFSFFYQDSRNSMSEGEEEGEVLVAMGHKKGGAATMTAVSAVSTSRSAKHEAEEDGEWQTKSAKKQKRVNLIVSAEAGSVKLNSVQQLITWGLQLTTLDPRRFGLKLEQRTHLEQFVVVVVEGLDAVCYAKHSAALPSLTQLARVHRLQLPGNKAFVFPCVSSLLHITRTNKPSGSRKETRHTLLLTHAQLEENLYPLPVDGKLPEGFVALPTPDPDAALHPDAPMFAIDCEMCETELGSELTRISVLDERGGVILDTLVKPPREIRDYKTRWSGITAAMLESVTTTLEDVQQRLLTLLPSNAILVGHSLDSDLRALKMHHTRVIDTAVLFAPPREGSAPILKSSLRWLAQQLLRRTIQASEAGHDSTEDARACLDLITRRLEDGPAFAPKEFDESLFSLFHGKDKRACLIDRPTLFREHLRYNVHCIPAVDDAEACLASASASARASNLLVIRLADSITPEGDPVAELNSRLDTLMQGRPQSLTLVLGCARIDTLAALRREKQAKKAAWTEDDESKMNAAVARARDGLFFFR